jgi:hypothetical protein
MTTDEIIELWNNDAPISELELGASARLIPQLHSKYYKIYIDAKREQNKSRFVLKRLRSEKTEFIINPTQEATQQHGWEVPDRKILKSEIKDYLDSDSEILKLEYKLAECELKVETLQEILKQIHGRNWIVKAALDDRAFLHGE